MLRLVRWLGVGFAAVQFTLYQAPSDHPMPFPRTVGVLVVLPLIALNLTSQRYGERLCRSVPHLWGGVQCLVDVGICLSLIWLFSFDPSSALWALLMLPVLAGALSMQRNGALGTWALESVGYVVRELWAASHYSYVTFDIASVTYRLGLVAMIAACTGSLAARLNARAAEGDALRQVAHASRRLTSLDESAVLQETLEAARDAGFSPVQLVLLDTGPDEPWQRRVIELATRDHDTIRGRDLPGFCANDDAEISIAPLAGTGGPLAVLVAAARPPVPPSAREALHLLASHAGVALHNARLHQRTEEVEETLSHQALHDELTGLANRRLLRENAQRALALAGRETLDVAVLLLDLDGFKEINDTLGHQTGDGLLQQVAQRLTETVRAADCVARLGGDEFAVLAVGLEGPAGARQLAVRVQQAMHTPFLVAGLTLDIEASIGVAVASQQGHDIDTLLRCADVAMYIAKADRAGIALYESRYDEHTPARLALLGDLRRALQSPDQLVLHYQPKIDLEARHLVGVEALLRWYHPQRGLVLPGEFIPTAEGAGLIHDLTTYVLAAALGQVAQWQRAGHRIPVAVNVSARCLLDLSLPDRIAELLRRHEVAPGLLALEITETAIMADPTRALTVLQQLSDQGISISIDDFGTGYSSMSYLRRLPVSELKIDRSFVSQLPTDSSDETLVRTIVDLGHSLGLHVVAEGVEDAATLESLGNLGCDVVQGFYVGRPMPSDAVLGWLNESNLDGELDDTTPSAALVPR